MSQKQIALSPDLKRLQDEGYEIDVKEAHIIITGIPYVNSCREILRGTLVSPLSMEGDIAKYDGYHVIHFSGEEPCDHEGNVITSIIHQTQQQTLAGIDCSFSFSNKPDEGYKDYYEKVIRYIDIISAPARSISETCTAATFRKVAMDENSPFFYEDTNASRAGISSACGKLGGQRIAIIGLGGTGAYVLDLLAKCPVGELHLFDDDIFSQHNAFRAPGAPRIEVFGERKYKTDYFAGIYDNMKKAIHSHPFRIDEKTIAELEGFDFVFLCIDSGASKKTIIDALNECRIGYIDTGISVTLLEDSLIGHIRNTAILSEADEDLLGTIPFEEDVGDDPYASNIQIADINALCANLAVIKWKKTCGFYLDNAKRQYLLYDTNDGEIKYEDEATQN
ncbi:MAG: ThiF family adenylyltransferase [Gordonibacter sp.]|nr:ThiF family adenylyltransferase [Gordonibacter sp.]